jgi:hypothetical protein
MATFNTNVKLGTRGNSLLSFNLYGCATNNISSCTPLPDYQDVSHTRFSGPDGLYVSGLTLGSTFFIYFEPNRMVSGHSCNMDDNIDDRIIPISGLPTPTPTPSPTPTSTPTATPTPLPCSFSATIVYGLSPTPTSTTTPPTLTPTPTPTPTPTSTTTPPTPTPTPIPTSTLSLGQCYVYRIDENSPINGQLSQYGIRYTVPGSISSDNALNSLPVGLAIVGGNTYNTYSVCSSVEPTFLVMSTPTQGTAPDNLPSGVYRDGPLGGCSGNPDCGLDN